MVTESLAPLDPLEDLTPESGLAALEEVPSVPDEAVDIVEALTMAWTTFTLYEDPTSIEAFDRAIETLRSVAAARLLIEIVPEGFLYDRVPVPNRREAAQRLARQMYSHGSAAIEVTDPPTHQDLMTALAVVSADPDDRDPNDHLRDRGVTSITFLRRELLAQRRGRASDDGVAVDGGGSTPGTFAHELLDAHENDPEALARRFVDEYRRVYDLVDAADHWGREEVVHAFIDTFFNLPRDHQSAVLQAMVVSQDRDDSLLFIDQLGSTELGELARQLSPQAQSLLIEYARVAAEHAESQHHGELLRLIAEAGTAGISETVTGRVDSALRSDSAGTDTREAVARLRAIHPNPARHFESGVNVMRGLMALAAEGDLPPRLAVVWAAKVTDAIRDDRLEDADRWLGALGGLNLPSGHRRVLLDALAAVTDRQVLWRVIDTMGVDGDEPGAVVRRAAPLFITDALIEQLATEASGQAFQRLTTALTGVAGTRPNAVAAHLGDSRARVVRAVVGALGRSGSPHVVAPILPKLTHPDPGVRAAALEASALLEPASSTVPLLTALRDPAEEVQIKAAKLLAEVSDHRIDSALIVRLNESRDGGERMAVVTALGSRTTPAAREALEGLASGFALTKRTRMLRRAARKALKGAS